MNDELEAVQQRYARRGLLPADRYSFARPDVFRGVQSVDRITIGRLRAAGLTNFPQLRLLEVGCGSGGNLLRFLRWGFDPANLVGNELLPDRVNVALRTLPPELRIIPGDARSLAESPFDIVYQSTVLSSILDDAVQHEVANAMWRSLKPGGVILSYDFQYNNPSNPDVRKVTRKRLRQLFPQGRIVARRATLAPPIARKVAGFEPAYTLLEAIPPLRTHLVVTVRKPT